jgi:solute carrier family 25 oxoglutarate transporter 11
MVKVRIQLGGVGTNPVAVAGKIVAEEGPAGLYKGLSAGILRQVFYGTSRLGIFRTLTNQFTPEGGTAADIPFTYKLGCSMVAGTLGAIIGTPADAALVRMQADSTLPVDQRRNYKNGIDAMSRMLREEGLSGFFSGAGPTVVRGLAINVGMLSSYDSYKKMCGPYLDGKDGQINRFFSGALSGWTAATVALPFDYVKTMLQKQKPDAKGYVPYKGMVDCAQKVVAEKGFLALYTGYPTFVIRICPHIMLTWVFMDNINAALKARGM